MVALGLPEEYPPLKTVDARSHNLPAPATPFVGRKAELAQIAALLQDPRCHLISLVGPGGSGKTRLAIQAAAQSVGPRAPQAFPGGVYLTDLTAIASPEGAVTALGLLGALIDKSFLGCTLGRFKIHPVLRQCAIAKLAAGADAYAEARSRHARYYSQWLSGTNDKLKGGDQLGPLPPCA